MATNSLDIGGDDGQSAKRTRHALDSQSLILSLKPQAKGQDSERVENV